MKLVQQHNACDIVLYVVFWRLCINCRTNCRLLWEATKDREVLFFEGRGFANIRTRPPRVEYPMPDILDSSYLFDKFPPPWKLQACPSPQPICRAGQMTQLLWENTENMERKSRTSESFAETSDPDLASGVDLIRDFGSAFWMEITKQAWPSHFVIDQVRKIVRHGLCHGWETQCPWTSLMCAGYNLTFARYSYIRRV